MLFGFKKQLHIGELGVATVKTVLKDRGYVVKDLQNDKPMQKRGVDLYVEGLGYLEVKTDSYTPTNFFFELDCNGKPGAVDRSCADCFCVYFFRHRVMYLLPRAALQKWLRENYHRIVTEQPNRLKRIGSENNGEVWYAHGLVVPKDEVINSIGAEVVSWEEEDEHISTMKGE